MRVLKWLAENWLVLVLGAYFIFIIGRSNLFWRSREGEYLAVWKAFAEGAGIPFIPGSFSPRAVTKPKISGKYRGREVEILADTRKRWGFKDSVLKISISIKNKVTAELPTGAFFVVGDPVKRTILTGLFGESSHAPLDIMDFPMKCVPQNLGNYLLSQKSAQELLSRPVTNDVLVNRQQLIYRQVGLEKDLEAIQDILEHLFALADSFERFSKNWIS
jgi:hypothetical protein